MMMRSLFLTFGTVCCLLAVARAAGGAVFVLANGGRIEGQLLNPDEKPRETFVVKTVSGGQFTLRKTQVERVEEKSEALQWYESALPKVPNTVDGHWTLAEQCKERGLKAQREVHLQQVLALDPDHKEARWGLGYSKVEGRWVKADEFMASQGYVRFRGTWRIAQDAILEERAEREDKLAKEWKQKLKNWCTWIAKARGNEQAAWDNIRAIDDPRASAALTEVLVDENTPPELKRACIDVLGRLRTPAAVTAFINRALYDSDTNVRDACLDQFTRFGTPQAVRAFEKLLHSADNQKVNLAATCLGALRDPEPTLSLINALVTEHKFKVQTGNPGQMSLGFGSGSGGGGNSFSAGGSTQLVKKQMRNEAVLSALVAIHPGSNFGYDIERWKRWYIDQKTPPVVSLRRND